MDDSAGSAYSLPLTCPADANLELDDLAFAVLTDRMWLRLCRRRQRDEVQRLYDELVFVW